MFVTTTTVDFARLFKRPEIKTQVLRIFLTQCVELEALVAGFVIMDHHMHAVLRSGPDYTVSTLMQRFKSLTARDIRPQLLEAELSEMSQQVELNDRLFWKARFRGFPLRSALAYQQKLEYTHMNPVRAGFVERPEQYPWSSSSFRCRGLVGPYGDVELAKVQEEIAREGWPNTVFD